MKIGKNNLCLLEKDELSKRLENIASFPEQKEMIASNTVQLLPVLANFYREYNSLYKETYNYLREASYVDTYLWVVAFEKEEEFSTNEEREDYKNRLHSFYDKMEKFTYYISKRYIKSFLGFDENSNIEIENNSSAAPYLAYVNNNIKELTLQVFKLYAEGMRNLASPFIRAAADLIQYFEETENDVKKVLPWFSYHRFNLPKGHYAHLRLQEATEDECLRILELYKSGKIIGIYDYYHDPKYKEDM